MNNLNIGRQEQVVLLIMKMHLKIFLMEKV